MLEKDEVKDNENHQRKIMKEKKRLKKSNSLISFYNNKSIIIISFILLLIVGFCANIKKDFDDKKVDNNLINYSNFDKIEKSLSYLKVSSSYEGPVFPSDGRITKDWVLNLIDFMKDFDIKKSYNEKYIDKVYFVQMLSKVKDILAVQKEALQDIDIPKGKNLTIVGDIHGQFYDLLHIFEINGYPSENNLYLFNGDFVDRGKFGLECLTTLIAFKILYPNYFFIARGNHEDKDMNGVYGFKAEVIDKYGDFNTTIFNCISEFYNFLPLGHIINKEILVVHGGLFSKDGVTLKELKNINRFQNVPKNKSLMCEILWSDPKSGNGTFPSQRGLGVYFGPNVTEKFLKENNLKLLIRSHETRMEGYKIEPGGQVITVFSAPNYCDTYGNKGALIKYIGGDMNPIFIKFSASPHPKSYKINNFDNKNKY